MVEDVGLSQAIGKRLMTWSIASLIIGMFLIISSPGPSTFLGGFGLQAIIWGVINFAVARFILRRKEEQSVEKESRTVRINIGLEIVYLIIGLIIIVFFFQDPYMVGNGVGLIFQGFVLIFLDLYYYSSLIKLEEDKIG